MDSMAYVKAVLDGDGFVSREKSKRPRIVLEVKDKEFAEKFISTLKSIGLHPNLNERDRIRTFNGHTFKSHMFIVRARCDETILQKIENYAMDSVVSKISYLTGLFDSEGNLNIKSYGKRRTCYQLQITNSDISLLKKLIRLFASFGIKAKLRMHGKWTPYIHVQRKDHIQKFIAIADRPLIRTLRRMKP